MDLNNIDLLELQTKYMKNDPTTKALCAALNPQFDKINNKTKLIFIYSNIDNLREDVLDELAWQMSIDWYNANADIETKRKFIKEAPYIHKHMGTPLAVEKLVQTYFNKSYIEEWFEYGGNPYFFRIVLDYLLDDEIKTGTIRTKYNSKHLNLDGMWLLNGEHLLNGYEPYIELSNSNNLTSFDKNNLINDLDKVKNKRSWFDLMLFKLKGTFQIKENISRTYIKNKFFIFEKNSSKILTKNKLFIKQNESISSTITIEKNLWYLDGKYLLNGTKNLNAEIIKEAI